MVGARSAWEEEGSVQKSTGLLMDASKGGISGNKVLVQEINPCNIGIELTQGCHLGPPDQLRNQNRECPGS